MGVLNGVLVYLLFEIIDNLCVVLMTTIKDV